MTGDVSLLDCNSDTAAASQPRKLITAAFATADMNTENLEDGTTANMTQRAGGPLDAVYYQCRASRLSSFRDVLVSISSETMC